MNNKPNCPINWGILPEWAQFVTIDYDGEIYCWDIEPEIKLVDWGHIWKNIKANYEHIGTMMFIPEDFNAFQHIWQRP